MVQKIVCVVAVGCKKNTAPSLHRHTNSHSHTQSGPRCLLLCVCYQSWSPGNALSHVQMTMKVLALVMAVKGQKQTWRQIM